MKKKILFVIVISFIFAISSFSQSKKNIIKRIDFCDLLSKPKNFLEKTIKLKANYNAGFEKIWLSNDVFCKDSNLNRIDVEFDENWIKNTNQKVYKNFQKYLSKEGKSPDFFKTVNVDITGVSLENKIILSDGNQQFHFVIYQINAVSKAK